MDKSQLITFCDYVIGFRQLGGGLNERIETPYSPELRAFIVARLGDNTPPSGPSAVLQSVNWEASVRRIKAFAALLREVADGIDPPGGSQSEA